MRRILDLQFLSKNLNFRIFIKIVCGFISRKIHFGAKNSNTHVDFFYRAINDVLGST